MTLALDNAILKMPPPSPLSVPDDDGVYYPDAWNVCPIDTMLEYIPQSYMHWALTHWYDDDPMTLVASGMFIYYEQGNNRASAGPDVYVIPGVSRDTPRRSYFMWREGQVPTFALEVVSLSNYRRDTGYKRELYRSWGVAEYWLYDPNRDQLRPVLTPPLQGLRLVDGRYEDIPVVYDPASGMYQGFSRVLGLDLRGNREWFRFINPATGEALPDPLESEQGRQAAETQRDTERQARAAAETQRDAERQARAAAEAQRDAERQARAAAETRNRELQDEIRRLREDR